MAEYSPYRIRRKYCRGSHANDIRVALIVGLEGYRVFSMCNTYLLGGRLVTSLDMILYIAGLNSYTDSHRSNWRHNASDIADILVIPCKRTSFWYNATGYRGKKSVGN